MNKRLLLLLLPFLLVQCHLFQRKKDDPQPTDPVSQLPPATQEGRNTFGCLLNGKPWIPKGAAGLSSNLSPYYDPYYAQGTFNLHATINEGTNFQSITLYSDSLPNIGTYSLNLAGRRGAGYTNVDKITYAGCDYSDSRIVYQKGTLTITKLAPPIISGTFEFTLAKSGCDTIKVTDGRFDLQL